MTGIHGLQHVERLARTHFADDDAVRTHPQGVPNQVSLRDLPATFKARWPRFQAHNVRLLQLQFGCVFHGNNPLVLIDHPRHRIHQCRLTGTGAARNHDIEPNARSNFQHARDLLGHGAKSNQLLEIDALLGELSNRDVGPVQRQRRKYDVDPAAVLQARIDHRARLIDPATDRGGDALADVA